MNLDHSNLGIAINDRLLLGEGLFETIKVQEGHPRFPELHWQRLSTAAQWLSIHFTLLKKEWSNLLYATIQKDSLVDGGIKVILSGGIAPRGLLMQGQESQLVVDSFTCTVEKKAVSLLQASWLRDANNLLYQFKTVSYLEAILARREAMQRGADDALFFNTQHHVTEATCANIFLINDGCLITPPQNDGVLPGITRLRILNHCRRLGIEHKEQSINLAFLKQAEAVFLTNSIQGIQYVKSLDGWSFASTHPIVEHMDYLLAEERS